MHYSKKLVVICLVSIVIVQPWAVNAQTEDPNNGAIHVSYVTNKISELLDLGCRQVGTTDRSVTTSALALKWQLVIATTATDQLEICPPPAMEQLEVTEQASLAGLFDIPAANAQAGGGVMPPPNFSPVGGESDAVSRLIATLLSSVKSAGHRLFGAATRGYDFLLSSGPDNDFVRTIWLVILGVVNLFYMLILVLIALFTVLRVDIGGGVRRLLPRLLLSALLVNFSLVISLAILDIINIGTASITLIDPKLSGGNQSTIIHHIGQRSNSSAYYIMRLFGLSGEDATSVYYNNWAAVSAYAVGAVLTWITAIAMCLLVVALALRWVILGLLVAFSPIAYLLIALPGMSSWASKWWKYFLGWAFFPLGVIFVMWVTTQFIDQAITKNPFFNLPADTAVELRGEMAGLRGMLEAIILSMGLIAAIVVGTFMSNAGSNAVLGTMKQARRTVTGGVGVGLGAAGLAARGAYVGTGARRRVRRISGELAERRERSPILKRWFPTKEETVQRGRAMTARKTQLPTTPIQYKTKAEYQTAQRAIKDAKKYSGVGQGAARAKAMKDYNLANPNIARAVAQKAPDTFKDIARETTNKDAVSGKVVSGGGNIQNLQRVVRNKALMSELNDKQKLELLVEINQNNNISDGDKKSLLDEINKSMASSYSGSTS